MSDEQRAHDLAIKCMMTNNLTLDLGIDIIQAQYDEYLYLYNKFLKLIKKDFN